MDIDYQDVGMLKAFGLLDKLLRAGVPIAWCIKTPKVVVDAANGRFEDDFTASATDFKTAAAITAHGYRGGPFVIAAADATVARPIITSWQVANTTTIHVASAPFVAPVSRNLTAAPRIAVLADGNQSIAFSYLNAAGIPDDNGLTWATSSTSVLTPAQLKGPTTTSHTDGALFRPSGQPAFCEIMTMHWSVNDTDVPEVAAEMGEFLKFPVHVNAECQAVNAIEGAPPTGGRMKFVAPMGFVWPAPNRPNAVEYSNSSLPFAQQDGAFGTIGGSEPAYALPAGSSYYDSGIVMVRAAGAAIGVQDIWMTGYAGGGCKITDDDNQCTGAKGKVSYLGGHQYSVKTPISTNKTTQGTRLFLNSLYEAGCVTSDGQPDLTLFKDGQAITSSADVTWSITYSNDGSGPALSMVLTDALPAGTTFVSASNGGTFANGTVTWNLGDVGAGGGNTVTVSVRLGALGTYVNRAEAAYSVGLTTKTTSSNSFTTMFTLQQPDAGQAADAAEASDAATADGASQDSAAADGGIGDAVASRDAPSPDSSNCPVGGCPPPVTDAGAGSGGTGGSDARMGSQDGNTGSASDTSLGAMGGSGGAGMDGGAGGAGGGGAGSDASPGADSSPGMNDPSSMPEDTDGGNGGLIRRGKAGGCSCTIGARSDEPSVAAGLLLLVGLLFIRRRR